MSGSSHTTGKVDKELPLIDLASAYRRHAKAINESLMKVLVSGKFVLGENVQRFESEFASYSGVRYGVGVASGTDALTLSLMALGIKKGDEVITVANTASPTAMAILNSGAKPVFVDPSPNSLVMDSSQTRRALSRRTKAIIPVHLYGNPCDMQALMEFSAKHDLHVVEDCAQSHGATFNRRPVGSFGEAGCYSFYPTKNLGGFGDGGMVVTDSATVAEKLKSLRMYGMSGIYSSLERGLCSRLDEIQAAVLRTKLRYLAGENDRRRRNARLYRRLLASASGLGMQEETSGGRHVYHQFVVTVENRGHVQSRLAESGIGTGVHYPVAIVDQPAFSRYSSKHVPYSVSRRLAETILSLPIHPFLQSDAITSVASTLLLAIGEAS